MNQEQPTATTDEFFNDIGTERTSGNVCFLVAIGGKADLALNGLKRRD